MYFAILVFLSTLALPKYFLGQANFSDSLQVNSTLTFGGAYNTGILNQFTIQGNTTNRIKNPNWLLENRTTYSYSLVNNVTMFNDWTIVSRLSCLASKQQKFYPTLIHFYERVVLYKIKHSNRIILGSIVPFKDDDMRFFIGIGYENSIYAQENFNNSSFINARRKFGIAALNFENTHHFGKEKFSIKYRIFYIQSFKELPDFSFWFTPSLNWRISKSLSFAINYDFRYKNVHLIDLPSVNESLTFNISFSLGKQ